MQEGPWAACYLDSIIKGKSIQRIGANREGEWEKKSNRIASSLVVKGGQPPVFWLKVEQRVDGLASAKFLVVGEEGTQLQFRFKSIQHGSIESLVEKKKKNSHSDQGPIRRAYRQLWQPVHRATRLVQSKLWISITPSSLPCIEHWRGDGDAPLHLQRRESPSLRP